MTEYKSKLGDLANRLKNETPSTPVQEVQPVKGLSVESVPESRFNNWIPSSLKKRLKQFAADQEITLKDITIEALEMYLDQKGALKNPENSMQ